MKKNIYFAFTQMLLSAYCLTLFFRFQGFFYLLPIGLLAAVGAIYLLTKNRAAVILNIIFLGVVCLFYCALFYDLLVIKGYISLIETPFFLKSIEMHFPVILYSLYAIFGLRKILVEHQ